jgi:hypothetical protein
MENKHIFVLKFEIAAIILLKYQLLNIILFSDIIKYAYFLLILYLVL